MIQHTHNHPPTGNVEPAVKPSWAATTMLVIDEISVLSAVDLFNVERHLRDLKGRPDVPFIGGVHVVFVGDFHQLPPVTPPTPVYPTYRGG